MQQGPRKLQLEDYLAIGRRRVRWIVVPTIVVPLLAIIACFILPARYTSVALILIEGQKVPGDYVKSVVNEDLNNRLMNIKEQIFSRTRLQPVIERFRLYSNKNLSLDEKLAALRQDVVVTPLKSEAVRNSGAPGFTIVVTAPRPQLAQELCGEIASMFFSENLKTRQQSAEGTTEFLKGQLEEAKRSLDAQDAKLASFQKQYLGQLPDQEQSNLNQLATLNAQLNAATEALSRAEQERTYIEAMLNQQTAAAQPIDAEDGITSPQQLQNEMEQLQSRLTALQARYTADYPDVLKARRELEATKKRLEAANAPAPSTAATKKPAIVNPQIQQLRAQLEASQGGVTAKKAEQSRIEQQINLYQSRLQLSPMVGEQYKQLTRDYETAQHFYNDLLNKKNQSEMATELERQQQGEQFRLIDPPNLPEKPTFPDRLLFALGGLGAGLALGCGLALFVDVQDKSLRSERDVLLFTKLEPLAVVPVVQSAVPPGEKHSGLFGRRNRYPAVTEAAAGKRR